jgi:DNA-binding transcriptional MocR family regulator
VRHTRRRSVAGTEGVNVWIHLPSGFDAGEVIERAGSLGVLVAPREVFYLSPGHSDVIRFNVGSVETDKVSACAELLAGAIRQSGGTRSTAIHVSEPPAAHRRCAQGFCQETSTSS